MPLITLKATITGEGGSVFLMIPEDNVLHFKTSGEQPLELEPGFYASVFSYRKPPNGGITIEVYENEVLLASHVAIQKIYHGMLPFVVV